MCNETSSRGERLQPRQPISGRCNGLTALSLHDENVRFAATPGVSEHNRSANFVPGYLNSHSGEWVLSRFRDGTPAPVHVLDGLPPTWVARRDAAGNVVQTRPGIISGFIRNGLFYTREEAMLALC
ncbi:dihydroorotase [Marichromatium bheemlicum]|uniref:Dihydroorotase n=1 Tax=Marichromatium bheemlicum TaxID=365339 RepID=A0ABX1I767_9GAMM|nr:dihydroorotase [Marichromatium bheemlicum]NKN33403.1 dihydroorotase [Marichromatium bheemlicum]